MGGPGQSSEDQDINRNVDNKGQAHEVPVETRTLSAAGVGTIEC